MFINNINKLKRIINQACNKKINIAQIDFFLLITSYD